MDTNERLQRLEEKIDLLFQNKNSNEKIVDSKTMDANGRITIPKSFRKILGIENVPTEFLVILNGENIVLKRKIDSGAASSTL